MGSAAETTVEKNLPQSIAETGEAINMQPVPLLISWDFLSFPPGSPLA